MSKLAKDFAKLGRKIATNADKKGKSKAPETPTSAAEKKVIDKYLKAAADEAAAAAAKADAQEAIREMGIKRAFDFGTFENLVLEGTEGAVNVIFKDQYSIKDRAELDQLLVEKKLDPSHFITESATLSFAYDVMTPKEQKLTLDFVHKNFGDDRFAAIVTSATKLVIKGLMKRMINVCKGRDELDALRQASGHHTPTVSVRK